MARRPNFLFIITDQQRADHLGCYGNDILRTPNIDSLAARGTRFARFYVNNPSCMPNRASLMTGRMPSAHGVWSNGVPLSLRATTFVHLLRAAGYHTGLVGKCHLQGMTGIEPVVHPPAPEDCTLPPAALRDVVTGFLDDGRYDQEIYPNWRDRDDHEMTLPYYGFEHVDLCILHGDKVSGHYARWARAREPGFEALRGPENELGGHGYTAPWTWRTRLPEELYPSSYVAERTIAFLDRHLATGDDTPFFVQCAFPDPHHPFTPPGRYWDLYQPGDVELPAAFVDRPDPPPHLQHLWQARDSATANRWTHLPLAITAPEARQVIALTYGMLAMIDDAVGRILAHLEATGLAQDTVVVFTSDHGDFMADHQILLKGPLHYQGLVRVPFIWRDPARPGDGGARHDLCAAHDFAPTVLARAGLAPFYGMQGHDLFGEGGHASILIEEDPQRTFMGFEAPPRARTLITERYRLTLYEPVEWGELYDLDEDPCELRNLWAAPAHAALRAEMLGRLAHRMMATSNRAPLPTHRG